MPTGYTSPVMNGEIIDVKGFAAECIRAFGVFMHMRDEPISSPLRYPTPPADSYNAQALTMAQRNLVRWEGMDEEERYAEWSDYAKKQNIELHNSRARSALTLSRYESMLAQVHSVETPPMLKDFKDFMISQLEDSIEFDCDSGSFEDKYYRVEPYEEWCDSKSERLLWEVDYCEKKVRDEKKRYEECVAYIDALVETFGIEVEK